MKSLVIPGVFLLAVATLLQTGVLTPSPVAVIYSFYGASIVGLLLAWRFHSTRIFSALLVLFLGQAAISYFSSVHANARVLGAVGVILPVNFVLLSLRKEKGFIVSSLAPAALALFVESVIVAVICSPGTVATSRAVRRATFQVTLPFAVQLAFSAAAVILLIRYLLFHKPTESGLFWALAASFPALYFGGVGKIATTYFAAAAFLLGSAIVETSYLLAYHDELTTLPSRRAFNDALLRLEAPYSIAMVDIDHFKRCNDTYGHDTGDQVLRMVASRLARVSGGGQAYRCGGEEFAVVFPGKSTREVLEPLEQLRATIESSRLRLRGPDRRHDVRGPDRRNQRTRARASASHILRQLEQSESAQALSVTASIGIASARQQNASPQEIIELADKALYRAKSSGRNRIETASSPRRRVRTKSAGIA